jgi:putative transposase
MSRRPYPTDLADAQWELVRSVMPGAKNGRTGTPRRYPPREICNATFYHAKNRGTWRALPHDFPPWPAVWQQHRRWRDNGTLDAVHEALRSGVRRKEGRRTDPSAAILDSESVRVAEKKRRCWGYNAGKKITGRKRHLLVDTIGLILTVVITAARVQDRDGGPRGSTWASPATHPRLILERGSGGT